MVWLEHILHLISLQFQSENKGEIFINYHYNKISMEGSTGNKCFKCLDLQVLQAGIWDIASRHLGRYCRLVYGQILQADILAGIADWYMTNILAGIAGCYIGDISAGIAGCYMGRYCKQTFWQVYGQAFWRVSHTYINKWLKVHCSHFVGIPTWNDTVSTDLMLTKTSLIQFNW